MSFRSALGESGFDTRRPILQAGIGSLELGHTHHTSNSSTIVLRTALAEHPKRLYGVAYDARSEVLVAVGVSEALYLAQTAVLDPGDEVIVPMPCFVAYQPEAVFPGGTPVPIETTVDDQLRVSAESLEAQITHSTKALLISYPNNPTGTVMWCEGLLA
jgi:aminotransferase